MQGSSNFKRRTTEKTRGELECNVTQRCPLPGMPPCSMSQAYLWLIRRCHPQTRPDCDRGVAIVRLSKYVCNAALSNWNRSARGTEVFSGPSKFSTENIDPFLGDSSCCLQL